MNLCGFEILIVMARISNVSTRILQHLGAIPVFTIESKSTLTRVVHCMAATANKAKQHVALDPLLMASIVESLQAVGQCIIVPEVLEP